MISDWRLVIVDFLKSHWLGLSIGAALLLAALYGLLKLRAFFKGLPFF